MSSPTSSINTPHPPPRTFKPYRCLYPFCIKQYLSSADLEAHYASHPSTSPKTPPIDVPLTSPLFSPADHPPALTTSSNASTPSSTNPPTPTTANAECGSPLASPRFFSKRTKPTRSHTAPAAISRVQISRPSISPARAITTLSPRPSHSRAHKPPPGATHHSRSTSSATTATSASLRSRNEKAPKKDPRTSGTMTRCGRHGDEWLFGGWSGWKIW